MARTTNHFDLTMDSMEDILYRNRAEKLIRDNKWTKSTHFTREELVGRRLILPKI